MRRKKARRKLTFDQVSFFVVFLGLPLAIFLLFVVWPFVQAFYYSLTDWSGFTPDMNFVGLENYRTLLNDDIFMTAFWNNILLAVVLPLVTVVLSFVLATMVTVGGTTHGAARGIRNSGFYRVISFFPYTIPAIIIGILWSQMFDPSAGLLNGILTELGFDQFASFPWLGDTRTAMPASMFVIIWGFVGFYMVLFVAAIKGIPSDFYDAIRLDGAGRFRTAISITIPLIRDNIQTAYIYLGILALDAFVYMQALNPGGGPDNSTLVMPQRLLNTAFTKGQFGLASAMGVVLAVATLTFAALVFAVNWLTGGTRAEGQAMTTTTPTRVGDRRAEGRHRRLACRPQPVDDPDHRPAAVDADVVVQDEQGDLRLAVHAAGAVELRQLRLRVDHGRHRQLLRQHRHRGRLRPGHRHGAGSDVRLRARPLHLHRQQGSSTT